MRRLLFAPILAALALAVACGDGRDSVEDYRASLTAGLDEFVSSNAALIQGGFPEGDRAGYTAFFSSYRDAFDRLDEDLESTDPPAGLEDEHRAFADALAAVSDRVGSILERDLGSDVGTAEALLLARLYTDLEAAETACTALDAALHAEDNGAALPCADFGRFASPSG